jgi:peptidase E
MEQEVSRRERTDARSALSSPGNGPYTVDVADPDLSIQNRNISSSSNLDMDKSTITLYGGGILRFIYVPTARYALKSQCTDAPDTQRQRARAEALERRSEIITTLSNIFSKPKDQENQICIHSVNLDFDDGSIEDCEGSQDEHDFPKTGKEALREWNPHLIYVDGGNTFWLYHCMEKGGWRSDLMDLIATTPRAMNDAIGNINKEHVRVPTPATTVYCGRSAGAILAGAKIETATWKRRNDPSVVPGRESLDAWCGVSGLDLLGGSSIFPHMAEQWESIVADKMLDFDSHVYCISDSQVCLVDGEQQTISMIQSNDIPGGA